MAKIVSHHFERTRYQASSPGHHQMNNQVGGVCRDVIGEQPLNEIDFVLINVDLGSKKKSCFQELRMEVDIQLQYLNYDS